MQRLAARHAEQVVEEPIDLVVDRRVLPVRRDLVLGLAPECVIGLSSGARFGSPISVIPSAARRDPLAVWLGSSSSSIATCQPRYRRRTSPRNAWKLAARPLGCGSSSRVPVPRFIAPKTTRRAFRPLMWTSAGSPRNDQPARNGGNSSRSVSSSASTTLRRGRPRTCRRMRRFLVALGVRVQDVSRPLPDVPEPGQHAPDGVVGRERARAPLQLLLKQRRGPVGVRIPEFLRRLFHQGSEEPLRRLGQESRASGQLSNVVDGDSQAAGCFLTPSTKTVPLTTSGRSVEPFNVRHFLDADSISLNTIVRHAVRLPLPLVLS